jgi:hypothetical protein
MALQKRPSTLVRLLVKIMNGIKKCNNQVIGKSIRAIQNARQALYAATVLHTVAPLLLLMCLVIPLLVSTHG